MRRFKDVRKEFERSSECLEGAQSRNAQAPRGKQHEVEEASNNLLNARRGFRSEALDYVLQVRGHVSGIQSPGRPSLRLEQTQTGIKLPSGPVHPSTLSLQPRQGAFLFRCSVETLTNRSLRPFQINVIEAKKKTDILMAVSLCLALQPF